MARASHTIQVAASGVVQAAQFDLNINNGVWFPATSRFHMEWSGSYVHPTEDNVLLQCAFAMHQRPAGDHTAVRRLRFFTDKPPLLENITSPNDPFIGETDNFMVMPMFWRSPKLLAHGSMIKIVDIDTPSFLMRNYTDGNAIEETPREWKPGERMMRRRLAAGGSYAGSEQSRLCQWEVVIGGVSTASPTYPSTVTKDVTTITQNGVTWISRSSNAPGRSTFFDEIDIVGPGSAAGPFSMWSKYNAATMMNPGDRPYAVLFGGGNGTNSRNGGPRTVHVIDDNPNFPATSTKPFRFRQRRAPSSVPWFPIYCRNVSVLDDWLYWGCCRVDTDLPDNARHGEKLYRIHVPTLVHDLTVDMEELPDKPGGPDQVASSSPLIGADDLRKRIIVANHEGLWRYHVEPRVWDGPHTFENFSAVISEGDAAANYFRGFQGAHFKNLGPHGETYICYNLSKRWNRVRWKN